MTNSSTRRSLDCLLKQAPLPVSQALRYSLNIAIALRSAHDRGNVCGALDPSRVQVDEQDAAVKPADAPLNAYSAPELSAGSSPDVRSDIYAFGAVLYQMLTGVLPAGGDFPREPLESLKGDAQKISASQFPGLEHLIFQCLEWNPSRRWQSFRAICMELRLLNNSARRREPARSRSVELQIHQHISKLETALVDRIAATERGLVNLIAEEREQVHAIVNSFETKLGSQAPLFDELKTALAVLDDRLESIAASVIACDGSVLELQLTSSVARTAFQGSVQELEKQLGTQAESIEALQSAISQTDDLLERMVDTIDSLHSLVFERTGEPSSNGSFDAAV